MEIIIDTTPLVGLINRRDQWHRDAVTHFRILHKRNAKFLLPRIVYIETLGHLVRLSVDSVDKSVRESHFSRVLLEIAKIGSVLEHEPADFELADNWFRAHADWPMGYPDALIAATLARTGCNRVWTFDYGDLTRLIRSRLPGVEIHSSVPTGNG